MSSFFFFVISLIFFLLSDFCPTSLQIAGVETYTYDTSASTPKSLLLGRVSSDDQQAIISFTNSSFGIYRCFAKKKYHFFIKKNRTVESSVNSQISALNFSNIFVHPPVASTFSINSLFVPTFLFQVPERFWLPTACSSHLWYTIYYLRVKTLQ